MTYSAQITILDTFGLRLFNCYRFIYNRSMTDISGIVNAMKEERDRLNAAIQLLEGSTRGRRSAGVVGRPPKRRGRRRLSAAARRRISEAAKARWAKAKKAGRNSL